MSKVWKVATAALIVCALGVAAEARPGGRIGAGAANWRQMMPGVQFAPVYGDWETGAHGKFVRLDHGTHVPMHGHTNGYDGVVTSGRMANVYGDGQRAELIPGDYFHMPAGQPHSHECLSAEGCTFYTHSNGNWDMLSESASSELEGTEGPISFARKAGGGILGNKGAAVSEQTRDGVDNVHHNISPPETEADVGSQKSDADLGGSTNQGSGNSGNSNIGGPIGNNEMVRDGAAPIPRGETGEAGRDHIIIRSDATSTELQGNARAFEGNILHQTEGTPEAATDSVAGD